MPLSTLPLDSEVQIIVDWLEFNVLCSEFGVASISDLQRTWDVRRNTEDSDFEDGDTKETTFLQTVCNEILYRIECLEDAYPFVLSQSGESLEVKGGQEMTDGAFIYLLCLFLSHFKKDEVLEGTWVPHINNEIRDLFQACSTLAAASIVSGHSYSFGFPRPKNSGFLTKLKEIYDKFGEGVVVASVPAGASRSTKDDQIDVIAWGERPDRAAGKLYLLGQVASGNNWPNKSIKGGAIEKFHGTWFGNPRNSSQALAALFIPFCVSPEEGGSTRDRINVLTFEFGSLYYRHLIPKMAQTGIQLAREREDLVIERLSDVSNIVAWVTDQVNVMRKVALA